MRPWKFSLLALAVGVIVFALALALGSDYLFFAGYVVLQFIVLATAWNILGGYCGYVNFGTAAFFAIGTYSSVAMHKLGANSGRLMPGTFAGSADRCFALDPDRRHRSGAVAGVIGLGMGYLTLRLRGVFFAIARWPWPWCCKRSSSTGISSAVRARAYIIGRPASLSALHAAATSVPVPDHALLGGGCAVSGAPDRALAARLRLCHHPRR
jgi:hypothetical protein